MMMKNKKILIVEDETIVALDIRSALRKLEYEVTSIVTNFEDAIESVNENMPDIIIMDINLNSKKDGIDTAHAIKKIRDIPIIYLTAFSDDATINRAVQTNPIGYLIKPFKREELKTTIVLGLHKFNNKVYENKSNYKDLGLGYYYDLSKNMLFYKNIPMRFSQKENLFLKILIEANGHIVSLEDLEYIIWPDDPVSDSTLRTLIYRIRTKLDYKLIETLPSIGCKLTPII